MLICCLITMYVPSQAHAQTTLQQCKDLFDATLVEILVDASAIHSRLCITQKGRTVIGLTANQASSVFQCDFRAKTLYLTKGRRQCEVKIEGGAASCGTLRDVHRLEISGRVAAQWKKFLQGEGCQIVMNVSLPE